MIKSIVLGLAILSLSSVAQAKESYCHLPKDCKYLDSEFSTGGGDKASYIMEVTCKIGGSIVKYNEWRFSAANYFGMGRISMPRKIAFYQGKEDKLICRF